MSSLDGLRLGLVDGLHPRPVGQRLAERAAHLSKCSPDSVRRLGRLKIIIPFLTSLVIPNFWELVNDLIFLKFQFLVFQKS